MGVKGLFVEKHSPKDTISAYKDIREHGWPQRLPTSLQEIAFTMLYIYIYLLHDLLRIVS